MKLQRKLLLITFLTVAVSIVIIRTTSYGILGASFRRLETEEASRNLQRALTLFEEQLSVLDRKVAEWANSDDACGFVQGKNPEFPRSSLTDSVLAQLSIELIAFLDGSGQIVELTAFDLTQQKRTACPEGVRGRLSSDSLLLNSAALDRGRTGIVSLPAGPMMIASRPIRAGNGKGLSRGTLIMGRFLDPAEVQRLADLERMKLDIHGLSDSGLPDDCRAAAGLLLRGSPGIGSASAGQPPAARNADISPPVRTSEGAWDVSSPALAAGWLGWKGARTFEIRDDNTISAYAILEDISGKPSLLVRVDLNREIYHHGQDALWCLTASLLVIGIIVAIATVLLLRRLVLNRLARLSAEVNQIGLRGDLSARVTVDGRDELADLAVDINGMLGKLQEAMSEVARYRQHLESLVQERTSKLVQTQQMMMQSEKLASVGQLATGVAHEINTPIQFVGDNLNAISDMFTDLTKLVEQYRGLVELVQSGSAKPESAAAIRETETKLDLNYLLQDTPQAIAQGLEGVQRVAKIVRAMKDFSHVKGDARSAVDINHAIQSTLTVTKNEYKQVADVETDLGELPPVDCCGGDVNQVLLNIVVNAAHAIADTHQRGKITIVTREEGEQVRISITDTGTGIPEHVLAKIYDPFFTTKEIGRGTGQGLSIAHQVVVRQHGGSLTCASEVGKGTTFHILLPIRAKQMPPESADSELVPNGDNTASPEAEAPAEPAVAPHEPLPASPFPD